jgi:hypothetical protein
MITTTKLTLRFTPWIPSGGYPEPFEIHCYRRTKGRNVFDEEFAQRVIDYVESHVVEKP